MTEEAKKEEVAVESKELEQKVDQALDTGLETTTSKTEEFSEQEKLAMDQGWKPLSEWEGDPKDHRSAREYLDRGELLTKIKSASQEIRQLKEVTHTLSEHNKRVFLAGYQRAIGELNEQKIRALEAGKSREVVAIDEQLNQKRSEMAAVASTPAAAGQQTVGPTPAFEAFKENNSWYNRDQKLRDAAHGAAIRWANEHPNASEEDVYKFMNTYVREEFPEKFKSQAGPGPDRPGRGTQATKSGGDAFEKLVSQMPDDLAAGARALVKRGLITKEKYVADYLAISNR